MDIFKSGTRLTNKASSEYFTGTVLQDPILEAPEPARVRTIRVTFEPAWNCVAHSSARTDAVRAKRYWLGWLKGRTSKNYHCRRHRLDTTS